MPFRRPRPVIGLLLECYRLQPQLIILHRSGFQLKPCGQVGDFLGGACAGKAVTELFQALCTRGDGSANVIGKSCLNPDIARVQIKGSA